MNQLYIFKFGNITTLLTNNKTKVGTVHTMVKSLNLEILKKSGLK